MNDAPGFRITTLHAFLTVDTYGDEGVITVNVGGNLVPLIGTDEHRLAALRPFAEQEAAQTGRPVRHARFSVREDIETIS